MLQARVCVYVMTDTRAHACAQTLSSLPFVRFLSRMRSRSHRTLSPLHRVHDTRFPCDRTLLPHASHPKSSDVEAATTLGGPWPMFHCPDCAKEHLSTRAHYLCVSVCFRGPVCLCVCVSVQNTCVLEYDCCWVSSVCLSVCLLSVCLSVCLCR